MPPKGQYVNVHAELMSFFARNLWRKIWEAISPIECCELDDECDALGRLNKLDLSGNGLVTVDEIQVALRDKLGLSIDDEEKSLAQFVHSLADISKKGFVTLDGKAGDVYCASIV